MNNYEQKEHGNVLKMHLLIFSTSTKTGVRLKAPHRSEAVQKIETKITDANYNEQFNFTLELPHFYVKQMSFPSSHGGLVC